MCTRKGRLVRRIVEEVYAPEPPDADEENTEENEPDSSGPDDTASDKDCCKDEYDEEGDVEDDQD